MTDPTPHSSTVERPTQPKTQRYYLFLGAVIGALLLALVAQSWHYHNRLNALRREVARQLTDAEQSGKENRLLSSQAQEAAREAQAKVTLLEARLAESQHQQAALEALYRELTPTKDDWTLTEVEQLLLLASQHLQLGGNVQSALAALQAADARIQRFDKPQFVGLRKALTKDMERLKALPFVDVTGMSLRLEQIIAGADKLPFVFEERVSAHSETPQAKASETEPNRWRRLARDFWDDLKQLVKIEQIDQPDLAILSPSQQSLVRENLKLRLVSARLTLLARDEVNFRADLKAAEHILKRYFDQKAKPTQAALTSLQSMQTHPVALMVPELSASLDAISSLRITRDRGAR